MSLLREAGGSWCKPWKWPSKSPGRRYLAGARPGRNGAAGKKRPHVGTFWPSSPQRQSSEGPCTSEVRRNARGVCVARWYDPGTGEFLSVDPDFSQTLDAYGYADENPLDGADPSGLRLGNSTSGECVTSSFDPQACESNALNNAQTKGAETLGADLRSLAVTTATEQKASAAYLAFAKECPTAQSSAFCSSNQGQTEYARLQGAYATAAHNAVAAGQALGDDFQTEEQLLAPPSSGGWKKQTLVWGGVVLGVAAVALGVGALVVPLVAGEASAAAIGTGIALGVASAGTGFIAAGVDGAACASNLSATNEACYGAVFGAIGIGLGLVATGGLSAVASGAAPFGPFATAAQSSGVFGLTTALSGAILDAVVQGFGNGKM